MASRETITGLCADLSAEHDELDALVSGLTEAGWRTPTASPGWTIADQVSHLAWFDDQALLSASDPERFRIEARELVAAMPEAMDRAVAVGRALAGNDVLAWWRTSRVRLTDALAGLDPSTRLDWYGPPMGVVSFVTARLMETWAHGQDVVDALGDVRVPTGRLRHVAHIGVNAMAFNFASHGRPAPSAPVRVELRGPAGEYWAWGPDGATDSVCGDALSFCLVVTQRRHLSDCDLDIRGPQATEWMAIAQAFAGPPGAGRRPGQFA